jgi:hypothetical protein
MTANVPYFYRPIPAFNGKILKCAGICTPDNVIWFTRENPGTVIVDHYLGDRVRADDLSMVEA